MEPTVLRQAIIDLPKQLAADLPIVFEDKLLPPGQASKFAVCGMGGSALAASLLKLYCPALDLVVHRDYGLPFKTGNSFNNSLSILSSYSGNTEEVLAVLDSVLAVNQASAVISAGGQLLARAKERQLPHIVLPHQSFNGLNHLPPRLAVGYSFAALCRFCLPASSKPVERRRAAEMVKPLELEAIGRSLAEKIGRRLPLIYASTPNRPLAYYWKISLNETAKTAAFLNVLPELNHNEMEVSEANFIYLFLRDSADRPEIQKRFSLLGEIFRNRQIPVEEVSLPEEESLIKLFSAVILASWTAYYLALKQGRDPVAVPAIEEFKQRFKSAA